MLRMLPAAAISAVLAAPAAAQTLDEIVSVELREGWREADGTHVAALQIALADGWKTYWRAPGDAGIPPRLDWSGSQNLAAVGFHWPVPQVFYANGMRSVGYEGLVILPLRLRPENDGPIQIDATVEIGVCEDICIPVTVPVTAVLPPVGADDPAIRAALADRPLTAAEAGIGPVRCTVEPIADGLRLTAEIDAPATGGGYAAVIEAGAPSIWVSEPMLDEVGGTLVAVADLVPPEAAPFALDRSALRFTLVGDGEAIDIRGCQGG